MSAATLLGPNLVFMIIARFKLFALFVVMQMYFICHGKCFEAWGSSPLKSLDIMQHYVWYKVHYELQCVVLPSLSLCLKSISINKDFKVPKALFSSFYHSTASCESGSSFALLLSHPHKTMIIRRCWRNPCCFMKHSAQDLCPQTTGLIGGMTVPLMMYQWVDIMMVSWSLHNYWT